MSDTKLQERLETLNENFQSIKDFHERSFREIDAKAKYWLTVALPTFVALAGILYKQGAAFGLPLMVSGYALGVTLFVSVILLSWALGSRSVECGILRPAKAEFSSIQYYLEGDERWLELQRANFEHLLTAISNNECQNSQKSKWLSLGEASLLRGSPTAIVAGAGMAFGYTTACPSWFATPTIAGAVAGIIVGLCTSATFVALAHNTTEKYPAS